MRKIKGARISESKTVSIIIGVAIAALSLLVCSAVCALLLTCIKTPTRHLKVAAMIALLISGAVAASVISHTAKEGAIRRVIISVGICSVIILLLSLIFTGGRIGGRIMMNIACYIMISVFFSCIKLKKGRRRKRR